MPHALPAQKSFSRPAPLRFRSPLRQIASSAMHALFGYCLFAGPAAAADFYAGKTIKFVVGADVGGGYDIYARVLSRHLGRFIPGQPTVVVQNMAGAGSGRTAAFIYAVAPKDGTTIGALMPGAIIGPLLDDRSSEEHYDPTKFFYLGTADSGTRICATFHTSTIKTFEDAQKQKLTIGASQAGGATLDYAYLFTHAADAKFQVVSGYKGTADITLAMERGEVDGLCGFDWASLRSQKPDWIRDNKLNILVQVGPHADPELTRRGVPEAWKFIKNDDLRKAVEVVVAQQAFGRPYIAPPGTPPEQLKILRDAFIATMQDKEFLADAEKTRIDITPESGESIQATVQKLYASPKEIVERAKQLIKP
jgi:tripartite-type tricarboxylate transporter receptor subunit TctC